jgi:uncharacterized protein YcbX
MPMQLTGIAVHPVKSTAIRHVDRASVTPTGLAGDRRWMVVDGDGAMLSAREDRRLFTIVADTPDTDTTQTDALLLRHRPVDGATPSCEPVRIPEPDGPPVDLSFFGRPMRGVPADATGTAWVREVLDRHDLTLVWCDDPTRRVLNPAWARPGESAAFPDSSPVSLVSAASVRQVSDWVVETCLERGEEPVAITPDRFRPNLLVDGADAFAEDGWHRIRIGECTFRLPAPIDRCVMTTIDPATLDKGHEPIRTLARHRKWDGATWVCVKVVPEALGTVRLGDEVEVLESR